MKDKIQIIREKIERDGRISRNWCLAMRYTRLAARVSELRRLGWKFVTKNVHNDFVYYVEKRPKTR